MSYGIQRSLTGLWFGTMVLDVAVVGCSAECREEEAKDWEENEE